MQKKDNVISFRVSDGNSIKLEYHDFLHSTTELAREYARAGYPDRYAVFAQKQTSSILTGTKLGDKEYDKGIFISCILRPSIFPSQAGILGPLSTIAFATALEEHTKKKLGISWIKDIYCDNVKIGGCSIEGKLDDYTSYEYIIITFAARLDPKNFPPLLTDLVRQVFEDESQSLGMIMAKTVLNKFFNMYRDLKSPEKHMDLYRNKFVLVGKNIKYLHGDKKLKGKVIGIDKETTALLVESKKGEIIKITSPSNVIIPNKI